MEFRRTAGRICARFDDACWTGRNRAGRFPGGSHRALAWGGWQGMCSSSMGGSMIRPPQ